MSAREGIYLEGWGVCRGGVCLGGCLAGGGVFPGWGVCRGVSSPIACWDTHSPPREQNDSRCENITLPQTSFAADNYNLIQS